MTKFRALLLFVCILFAGSLQAQDFTIGGSSGNESNVFRAAPCKQSYFDVDLSEFKFNPEEKVNLKKMKPFMVVTMGVGEKEYIRILHSAYFDYDKSTIKTKQEAPLWGPFPYTGEPIQIVAKVYGYSGDALDRTLNLLSKMYEPDANQNVNSHHFSDISEELLAELFEASVQGGEIRSLATMTHTWVREASYTSILDFSVAQEGFFPVKSDDILPKRIENEERFNGYATLEEVPDDEKGKVYVIYELTQFGERPDLQAFEDYFYHYHLAEEAAYDGDAVRMEHHFGIAVNHIYANDNFTYEDKVRYHISEYLHLIEVIRERTPDYKGVNLPEQPCR